MDVLLTGGTGFIGRHLADELDDRGHDVTALARDPDPTVLPEAAGTVRGDVTDPDSIAPAFEGRDAVVNLVALSPLFEPAGGNEAHEQVHRQGTRHCLDAAEAADVEQFVQLSALGADPEGPTHYIRAKGRAENDVRESDLEWTIVRPSVVFGDGGQFVSFTERLKKLFAPGVPVYPLPGGGERTRFQPIFVGDLVEMLAEMLEGNHAGEVYELAGPEVLTLREVVEFAFESKGRSVSVLPMPMGVAKAGLSVLGSVPGFPMGTDQYRSLRFDNTTDENAVETFGYSPEELTTLEAYLDVGS